MTYPELLLAAHRAGFERVERDDRLLDIFPNQTKEKGVELWVKWDQPQVRILRIKHPYRSKTAAVYSIPTLALSDALQHNHTLLISSYEPFSASSLA